MNRLIKFSTLVLGLATTLVACSSKNETSTQVNEERIESVKTQKLQFTNIERNLNLSTTLQAYEKVAIAPALQGRISEVLVEVGDHVKKGQLVAKMDEATYIQTKLSFENLKVDFERISKLNESNNISKQTYDQTKAQYDIQKENLENIERNTYLRAPFDGVISAKNYENGELYTGNPILQLVQISTLKAYLNVPESYYPYVKKGMPIEVSSDIYPNKTFKASIEIVYPTVDAVSHNFQVQIRISNASNQLRPGMYTYTNLGFGSVDALIVPYQSILKLQGSNERYIFLNKDGVAKRVVVNLGQRFDDKIEIISNEIKAGDELITTGQARLIEGSKLKIVM